MAMKRRPSSSGMCRPDVVTRVNLPSTDFSTPAPVSYDTAFADVPAFRNQLTGLA